MANFLKSIGDYIKMTGWDQPVGIVKNVAKGDLGGAFDEWKGTFGDNNRGEQEIAHSIGIRGWVGDHPTETAGAVVGTILGGWMAGGALGGGAAAGGTASAAGGAGTAAGTGAGAATAGGSALSSVAPATSSLLSMGNAGVGASTATAGASAFTPAMLTTQGAAAAGGTYGAASAPAAAGALGTVPAASSAAPAAASTFDLNGFIRGVNALNSATNQQAPQQQPMQVPQVQTRRYTSGQQQAIVPANQQVAQALSTNNPFSIQNNPFSGGK